VIAKRLEAPQTTVSGSDNVLKQPSAKSGCNHQYSQHPQPASPKVHALISENQQLKNRASRAADWLRKRSKERAPTKSPLQPLEIFVRESVSAVVVSAAAKKLFVSTEDV
jgi:hypothetical protein